jgi:putative transposase
MSVYAEQRGLSRRFRLLQLSFLQQDGLPFANALPEEQIERAFQEGDAMFAEDEDTIYTPHLTLWAFLSQVLHREEQRSCLAAVSRVIVLLVSLGWEACAKNSGAYCKARAKLPEPVLHRLVTDVARNCEDHVPETWLWRGRHVTLCDGCTFSMPDTDENQAEYRQPDSQAPGLGFPLMRVVVLFSLATAMLLDLAMGPYSGKETGEMALLRQLLEQVPEGHVLLTDKLYCSYFLVALLLEAKCDIVVRLHGARKVDFTTSKQLGAGDHLVTWGRPAKPEWMDQKTFEQMPESIQLRLVEVQVTQPGFRTESFLVVTTLLNPKEYPAEDIANLYHQRWLVELDIRAIKVQLGMDVLRCKTPAMVRKEIWACLLAYNLIRKALLEAALAADRSPRELSFTNALQTIAASLGTLAVVDAETAERLIAAQLASLAEQRVGNRPNRVEPRAVKRRPKPHALLTMPREEARLLLLQGTDPYEKQK